MGEAAATVALSRGPDVVWERVVEHGVMRVGEVCICQKFGDAFRHFSGDRVSNVTLKNTILIFVLARHVFEGMVLPSVPRFVLVAGRLIIVPFSTSRKRF